FVVGIDPGLSRCGYGAVVRERTGLRAVAAGVIATPADEDLPARLAALSAELRALFAELRPDAVAVERVLFQANARTAMGVGQASGLALAAAAESGAAVTQYSPNEVKLAVVGYGSASKVQVQTMVQAILHLTRRPEPPDAADALALAICHLGGAGLASRVRQVNEKANEKVGVAAQGASQGGTR
ncbi:MAG TPA: crossover junction endodeoxyribonuclease RuvC, partial [Acidimicrobiales bacterium]|nr:crossover junction endodeoxyribonuclease RuvC [Acidimicrobiales bacterium]